MAGLMGVTPRRRQRDVDWGWTIIAQEDGTPRDPHPHSRTRPIAQLSRPEDCPLDRLSDRAGSIVLVEGESDRVALQTVAIRRGLDLQRAGVEVTVLGGAQAIGPYLRAYRDGRDRRSLMGLYDAGEETVFRRGLKRHGFGDVSGRRDLEARGFFCCDLDLEDELIRALGAPAVLAVIAKQGDEQPFRTLQHQPEWREQPVASQLRRFMGSGARRKIRYGRLLVAALDPDRVPRPLDAVLQAALAPHG